MAEGRKLDLEIHGKRYSVEVKSLDSDKATVLVNDTEVEVDILGQQKLEPIASVAKHSSPNAAGNRQATSPANIPPPVQSKSRPSQASSSNTLQAVMPGIVIKVLSKEGQQVKAGETLLIIEAMKMENEIRATRDAKISKILVGPGQKVQTGDSMIVFE